MPNDALHNPHSWFRRKVWTPLVVTVALAVLCAVSWFHVPTGGLGDLLATMAAILPPAALLAYGAYPLGYVLAARLVGFRFVLFILGPLRITSTESGLRLHVNDNWDHFLGAAWSVPVQRQAFTRRAALPYAAASLAPLAVSVMGLCLLVWLAVSVERLGGVTADPRHNLLVLFLGVTIAWSLLWGIITAVPHRYRGRPSGGATALMLLKGGREAERWFAFTALWGAAVAGQRPRDWDESWVLYATALPDGSAEDAGAHLLAYYWALDRGDVARAGECLERACETLAGIAGRVGAPILAEAAFFEARFRGNPALARDLLDRARRGIGERQDLLRAEAAILSAEGCADEARGKAEAALAILDQIPNMLPGIARAEKDWLRKMTESTAGPAERTL